MGMLTLICLVFSDLLGYIPRSQRPVVFALTAFVLLC